MTSPATKQILLVEDEAIIALAKQQILQRHGYAVTIAHSGAQAIAAFKGEEEFDLVLMDIDLGRGIDGTEAAKAILAEREVPVVFLSSHTEPAVVEQTEKITSYGYIVKSSADSVLLASIKMAFRLFEARINERRVLRKLIHSHTLMNYVISHARSAIAVHDRNLNYLYVSEEYLRSYDVETERVIGRHHYEVFPDLPQKWREVHQRSLRGEIVSAEDDVFERADGQVLWTRWECRPWYEDDGSIGGIIINTEITSRTERLNRILTADRNFLDTLLRTMSEGFLVLDSKGRILEANEKAREITGYRYEELIGTMLDKIAVSEGTDDLFQRLQDSRDAKPQQFVVAIRCGDDTPLLVNASVSPLREGTASFIVVFRSATDAAA
ncbi:MAG: PAS domain S-box protein [Alkalispirochaeta sp.]